MFALPGFCLGALQPPSPTPTLAQSQTPSTLAAALDRVAWNPAQRGALIVVAPETVPVRPGATLQPGASGAYNLRELAGAFDRIVVTVGGVTALAPSTMRVIVPPRESVEEASAKKSGVPLRALLASLSKEQWRTLSGENGLGLDDLSESQRGAFLASLPEPLGVQPVRTMLLETTEEGLRLRTEPLPAGMAAVTLTPEQRRQVRLRINRALTLIAAAEGNDQGGFGASGFQRPGRTEAHYELARPPRLSGPLSPSIADVPNRAKPGDLDFGARREPVALTGATTVGELVRRAAQGSRLELYADPRVANFPVRVWGESAPVGDVLAALCRAVTGTFRRVGPAYVLTHDREGVAALREPDALFQAAVSSYIEARRRTEEATIVRTDPRDAIAFAPDDPLALPGDLTRRLDARARETRGAPGVFVRDLPDGVRQKVAAELAQANEGISTGQLHPSENGQLVTAFRTDKVWLRFDLKASLIVPGYGALPSEMALPLSPLRDTLFEQGIQKRPVPATPAPLPWPAGERIALVRASTPDEARALARAARAAGLTTLWLKTPPRVSVASPLLDAARAENIAVGLAVSPFVAPPDAVPPGATVDLTATGVPSDIDAARWSAFRPETFLPYRRDERLLRGGDAVLSALAELARLPNLASLYLTELTPAGYELSSRPLVPGVMRPRGDFGYTTDNRLAFLRQTGVDPIDLNAPAGNEALPFLAPPRPAIWNEIRQQWESLRAAQAADFVPRLYAGLRQAAPELPVYVRGHDVVGWIGSWDRPVEPAALGGQSPFETDTSPRAFVPRAHGVARRAFDLDFIPAEVDVPLLRMRVAGMAHDGVPWDGAVLDLSPLPFTQQAALLGGLAEDTKRSGDPAK